MCSHGVVDRKYWESYLFHLRMPVFIWCVVSRTCMNLHENLMQETYARNWCKFLAHVSWLCVTTITSWVAVTGGSVCNLLSLNSYCCCCCCHHYHWCWLVDWLQVVLCEYSKFWIESNSYFSIRFETSTINKKFSNTYRSYLFNRMTPIFHLSNHV